MADSVTEEYEVQVLPYAEQYLSLATWPPWTWRDLRPPVQLVVYSDSSDILEYDGYTIRGMYGLHDWIVTKKTLTI